MSDPVLRLIDEVQKELAVSFAENERDLIHKYYRFLLDYNKKVNLISRKSETEVLKTGLIESYALFEMLKYREGPFLDVGSGGGIPGMLIGIFMPRSSVTLMDSILKKTVFIKQAAEHSGLENVKVLRGRLEEIKQQSKYDVVFSRGVGNFSKLKPYYLKNIDNTGSVIILTGDDNIEQFGNAEIFGNPYLPGRLIVNLEK